MDNLSRRNLLASGISLAGLAAAAPALAQPTPPPPAGPGGPGGPGRGRGGPPQPPVLERLDPGLDEAADAVACWATEGLEAAMNRFNRRGVGAPGKEA